MQMININKPKFDVRDFNAGVLENGVKYVLVNDKSLQKSFVSVSIHAGSFQNPKGYDGLAHFLEHMLFMGSKKYPNENHYNTKLNELGGNSNAYTDTMETVYYFNVFDEGLDEIMDIFSRFFIDPLFDEDSVNREINAVDSEHQKNINNDGWRKFQFILDLANPDTPVNTFITGSTTTLNKQDIRNKVIDFYNSFYTSNNISICVASSKPNDVLLNMLTNTFGNIVKKDINDNKLIITKPLYSNNLNKTFHLKSNSNKYDISYIYEIPYQKEYLMSKDFTIFDLILSEKSEKSLFFHLKNLGYLNNISIETKYEGLFIINLILTKEGYNNMQYCEHTLFDTIEQIVNMDINQIAMYFKKSLDISFDCLNKFNIDNLCNMLAVNHFYYPTENVFDGTFKIFSIKSTHEYTELYKQYLNTGNLIKIIHSQNYPTELHHTYKINPHYNYEYTELNLILDDSYSRGTQIFFDTENDFLNVEPSIVENITNFEIPILIAEKQWYGGCSEFGEPVVNIWMQLNNSNYFSDSKNYILTQISCSVLNFLSSVIMYKPLQLCYDIYFEPVASLSSVNINISALNDLSKLQILLLQLREFIFNIHIHFKKIDERFTNNLIVSFRESYQNIKYLNPINFFSYIIKSTITKTEYNHNELLEQLNTITYTDIESHIKSFFDGISLTTLTYGNIEIKNVTNLFSQYSKFFYNSPFPLPQIKQIDNMSIIHPNQNEKSNFVSYFYRVGKFTPKDYALILVLTKILGQTFFDILRTKYQLGYIVSFNQSIHRDEYYISEKIQSSKPVNIIMDRINDFNENIQKIIKDSNFEQYMETIGKELDEPDYSISDKISRYRPEISIRTYLFNRNKLIKDQLTNLTKHDIQEFTKKVFIESNKKVIIVNGN
jgi:insulysin